MDLGELVRKCSYREQNADSLARILEVSHINVVICNAFTIKWILRSALSKIMSSAAQNKRKLVKIKYHLPGLECKYFLFCTSQFYNLFLAFNAPCQFTSILYSRPLHCRCNTLWLAAVIKRCTKLTA
jgi:hypothetical protein